MCIRDSAKAQEVADLKNQLAAATPSEETQQELSSTRGERDQSVSYTHLRAHETVLDLVCRLLLEKKNTKNTEKEDVKKANHISNA